MEDGFKEISIDTEEMAEYVYQQLTLRGYHITEDEADEIADIMFDYLLEKSVIDEEKESD